MGLIDNLRFAIQRSRDSAGACAHTGMIPDVDVDVGVGEGSVAVGSVHEYLAKAGRSPARFDEGVGVVAQQEPRA
jgi:hypothetical protein